MDSLSAPQSLRDHIEHHGNDPATFLTVLEADEERVGRFTSDESGDALLACYNYTLQLESRQAVDRLRHSFMCLLYFDVARLTRPIFNGYSEQEHLDALFSAFPEVQNSQPGRAQAAHESTLCATTLGPDAWCTLANRESGSPKQVHLQW